MRTSGSVAAPPLRFEWSRLLSATRLGLPLAVIGVLALVAALHAALGAFMVHMMSALAAMLLLACVVNTRAKAGEGFIRYLGYAMPWVAFFEVALAFSQTSYGARALHAHLEAGSELVQAGIWLCAALYAGARIRPASASLPWGLVSAAIFGIVLSGSHGESTLAARGLALVLLGAALTLGFARRGLFAHGHPAFIVGGLAVLFAGQLFAMVDHTADTALHVTQFARLVSVWLVYLAALEGLPAAPWTSESTFRRMFEGTAVSVALAHPDGRLIAANLATARMYGYDSVDAFLESVPNIAKLYVDPVQRAALSARLEQGEPTVTGDLQFRRRDGEVRWTRLTLAYVRDASGNLLGLQGSAYDITEARAAQEQAALEQTRLRRLFELLPVGVWMTDDQGTILVGNEAGRRIWAGARYVGPERYGEYKGWWLENGKLISADEWPLARALASGETRLGDEIAIECFDGSRKIIRNSAAPILDEAGTRLGALVVNEDITAEKLRENALRESEARFRSLVELSSDYYWETDESLRFTVSTAAAPGAIYPDGSHVLGKRRWELAGAQPLSSSWEEHRALMEARKPFRGFQYLRELDGDVRYIEASGQPVFGAGGRFRGYRGVASDVTERKRAEEAQHRKDAYFRSLIENVSDAVAATDMEWRYVYVNPAMAAIVGVPAEELLGRRFAESTAVGDHAAMRARLARALAAADRPQVERFEVRGRNGELRVRETTISKGIGPQGEPIYIIVGRDITDRIRTEQALAASERKFRALIENGGDAVMLCDRELRVLYRGGSAERITGYPTAERLGRFSGEQVVPEDRAAFRTAFEAALQAPGCVAPVSCRYRRKDQSVIWIEGSVTNLLDDPAVEALVLNYRDVTARRAAEERLRQREAEYRTVVANSPDTIGRWGGDRRCLFMSASVANHSRRTPDWFVGKTVHELDLPSAVAARAEAALQAAFDAGRTEAFDAVLPTKRGERHFELGFVPERDEDGAIASVLMSARDITDRIVAERALAESEARLRRIIEVTPQPLLVVDREGTTIFANPAAGTLFGRPAGEIEGAPLGVPLAEGPVDLEIVVPGGGLRPAQMHYASTELDGRSLIVVSLTDLTERKRYEAHIEHLANHDGLTGLPNRMLLRDRVEQAILHAGRTHGHVALIFVDLDQFKHINDSYGHLVGDALLTEAAKRLKDAVRSGDTVARIGGDEFVIVLSDLGRPDDTTVVARKVAEALARPLVVEGRELHIGASMGISVSPGDGESFDSLLQCADAAMYRAKDAGRGTYRFYSSEMGEEALARVQTETGLRHALEREELRLHYQPQVAFATGAVTGFEALLRWEHPSRGLVSPASFIPIAEDSGLIVPIGHWALRAACRDAAAWRAAGLGDMRVAVNLSARQFWQGSVLESVRGALAESGLPPPLLEIEITESVVARDLHQVTRTLESLRRMGVTVAIDDFGTGYSSLAYLRSLPIQKLKIDRSFISEIPADSQATALVGEIVRLAHVLSLTVVAEGVETEAQARFLREAGCEAMQGFLFSRPLPAPDTAALLRSGRRLTGESKP